MAVSHEHFGYLNIDLYEGIHGQYCSKVMATWAICSGRLLSIAPFPPHIYCKRPTNLPSSSSVLYHPSNNAGSFFSPNLQMVRCRGRNGTGKLGLVAPVCAMQQAAISLPPIGSGMSVFQASSKISVNLIAICIFVAWLQKSGQLPVETPTVLSQVSFRLIIPCFLMSKVSKTIAFQPQGNLLSLPFISVVQILVGAMLGKATLKLISKDNFLIPENASNGTLCIGGLTERDEKLAKNNAIVIASCAFGNTVTLPLVILSGILSPNDASVAAGFVALFMVGWSPFLWSYGYQMFNTAYGQGSSWDGDGNRPFMQLCRIWIKRIMNPPLYGVLVGILIGGTPLANVFFPVERTVPGLFGKTNATLSIIYSASVTFLQSIWEAASLLGSASVAVQAIVLACSLAPSIPFFGINKSNSDINEQCDKSFNRESATSSQFVLDGQVFWVITCVRLLAMPLAGLIIVKLLHWAHILPSSPICILTILVLGTMPSAQNLVVLLQLRASTKPVAGVLADLLVRQYALSLVSIPLWITAYTAVIPLI